jgi:hypothetical protein
MPLRATRPQVMAMMSNMTDTLLHNSQRLSEVVPRKPANSGGGGKKTPKSQKADTPVPSVERVYAEWCAGFCGGVLIS